MSNIKVKKKFTHLYDEGMRRSRRKFAHLRMETSQQDSLHPGNAKHVKFENSPAKPTTASHAPAVATNIGRSRTSKRKLEHFPTQSILKGQPQEPSGGVHKQTVSPEPPNKRPLISKNIKFDSSAHGCKVRSSKVSLPITIEKKPKKGLFGRCLCRCKRLPFLSLLALILCSIGIIIVLITDIRISDLIRTLNNIVLKNDMVSIALPLLFDFVLAFFTSFVSLATFIMACLGLKDCGKLRWRWKLTRGIITICLLLLAVILHILWLYNVCVAAYNLGFYVNDKQNCKDYFNHPSKGDWSSVCLVISFIEVWKRRKICSKDVINDFCYRFTNPVLGIQTANIVGNALVVFGLSLLMCALVLNCKLQQLQRSISFDGLGRPEICNRLPLTTIISAVIAIVGLSLVSYTLSRTSNVEDFFQKNVTKPDDNDREFYNILEVATIVLTFLLVLLIVLIAFIGTGDMEDWCSETIASKMTLAMLMGIVFVFCLIWHVYGCQIEKRKGLSSVDHIDCKEYYKNPSENGTCVSVSFIKNADKRKLCDPDAIKNFCKKYVTDMDDCLYLYQWGNYLTLIGLLGLSQCVACNTILTMMEIEMGVEDLQPKRY